MQSLKAEVYVQFGKLTISRIWNRFDIFLINIRKFNCVLLLFIKILNHLMNHFMCVYLKVS